ncbi:MAG: hypothetical protein OEM62_10695 [Acidobacteriota bacterium]|nr:hypothetical protein [Acidobacteriota bacterium]
MRKPLCSREKDVLLAVREGHGLEAHRSHLASCSTCRETVSVADWLRLAAGESDDMTLVPEASAIWWRAQVVKRLCDREERIHRRARPLALVQVVALAVSMATIVAVALTSEITADLLNGFISFAEQSGFAVGTATLLAVAALASLAASALIAWRTSAELL